jgi:hypothetical protein
MSHPSQNTRGLARLQSADLQMQHVSSAAIFGFCCVCAIFERSLTLMSWSKFLEIVPPTIHHEVSSALHLPQKINLHFLPFQALFFSHSMTFLGILCAHLSKLSRELLHKHVEEIFKESKEKKRNFTETIELQIGLKNYDQKDKRFSGAIRLPTAPKPKFSVCVLADAAHIEVAQKLNVPFMDVEALKALKKSKKLIRKLGSFVVFFLLLSSHCHLFQS